jgi:hypothetical protein
LVAQQGEGVRRAADRRLALQHGVELRDPLRDGLLDLTHAQGMIAGEQPEHAIAQQLKLTLQGSGHGRPPEIAEKVRTVPRAGEKRAQCCNRFSASRAVVGSEREKRAHRRSSFSGSGEKRAQSCTRFSGRGEKSAQHCARLLAPGEKRERCRARLAAAAENRAHRCARFLAP